MKINLPLNNLIKGRFLERINRFVIRCQLDDQIVEAHLADPGRLKELLLPQTTIWLQKSNNPKRKTQWSAILVQSQAGELVSLVSILPNNLIRTALQKQAILELADWDYVRAEYPLGNHRFDFLLAKNQQQLLLEVKSVTLVENGVGLFPDAVTKRGRNHLEVLTDLVKSNPKMQCAVMFVVQRSDASYIKAAAHIDPAFATALSKAKQAGVLLLGRSCSLTTTKITLEEAVPVKVN